MEEVRKTLPAVGAGPQGLVAQMRQLAQAREKAERRNEVDSEERVLSYSVSTTLMLLLVVLIFATSALPDLMPRLTNLVQARL